MLVCSISQQSRRAAIAADIVETAAALDANTIGNIIFATLVDDPASVGEIVDAYLGEIMLEAASADDSTDGRLPISAAVVEAASAIDILDAGAGLSAPLDTVASVTGAWSFGRNMLTSFGAGTRYTTVSGAVDSLKDQKSSFNFNQTTSTQRPPLATAFPSGVLCADFDGDAHNQYLTSGAAISNFFTSSSGALVASVIIDAVTLNTPNVYQNHDIIAENGGYLALTASGTTSTFNFSSYNYDGNADVASITGTVGTAYVLMWRHHGGNLYVSINGGTEVLVASGNTQSMSGTLTMGWGYGYYCNMKLAEAFTTSDGSQTAALAAAIANMKTYIGA